MKNDNQTIFDGYYKEYTTKSGKKQFKPSWDWLEETIQADDNLGFCLACAATAFGVEPDATRYECEACGEHKVYGASELLIMGLYYINEPEVKVAKIED